ncbi:MAG: ATP-binding cassette domain-containing protein [Puniceicoccales bacterium]|jgi:phospholipid/cholesterol/gamma-HCH transport system ATP-binding protein|nr:ATP-binding cassette domain-containing protein [Puniceicoccales bacterium]
MANTKQLFSDTRNRSPVSIEVDHLKKQFRNHVVLDGISLKVEPGEIFVLMGPSGSGKSVFLDLLAGLSKPSSGRLSINQEDLQYVKKTKKYVIGLVFQSGALFNSMTIFDNLALYLREHRLFDEQEIKSRVTQILDMLNLKGVSHIMPSTLSGGMRKRVALARGLLMEPDVLLFDEPTSELDPITATSIIELIGYVNKQLRITTVIVSHDVLLAQSIGHHIALLNNKLIREIYTPQTLQQSSETFVRNFLNPTIDLNHPRFLPRRYENKIIG